MTATLGKSLPRRAGGKPACSVAEQTGEALRPLIIGFHPTYIHWMATERGPVARHDDHRDYDLLWRRDDYEALTLDAVDAVYDAERDSFTWSTHLAAVLSEQV